MRLKGYKSYLYEILKCINDNLVPSQLSVTSPNLYFPFISLDSISTFLKQNGI